MGSVWPAVRPRHKKEEPGVDVASAIRAGADEVLLLDGILGHELVRRPVDGALDALASDRLDAGALASYER